MNLWQKILAGMSALALILLVLFAVPVPGDAAVPTATLEWTAPTDFRDDGSTRKVALYEARFSTTPVGVDTLAWWNGATVLTGLPVPSNPGVREVWQVPAGVPFAWDATYHFVIIARDAGFNPSTSDGFNWSGWSNVGVKAMGPEPDTRVPQRIIDLIIR